MTSEEIYENLRFIEDIPLLQITDRSAFLVKHPHYHPSTKQYKQFKIKEYEHCIYGKWGKQKDKWRWIPPMTYLYCNYIKIEMENDKKETVIRLASLDDVEWIIGYAFAACYGFSGFEKEEEFSCDKALIDQYEMILAKRHKERYDSLLKPNGEFKTYITVEDYLYKEHDQDKGKPLWYNEAEDLMIFGSRSSGKMLQLDEIVRTYKGWTAMKDLKIGDLVYGSDGKLSPITFVSEEQTGEYYELTLRDGRKIEACADHLWKVWDKNKNKDPKKENYSVISTKNLFKDYCWDRKDSRKKGEMTKEYRYALPTNEAISEESELPLDPYLLGLLLGDGCITGGTAPSIVSDDNEIIEYCIKQCELNNWSYRINNDKNPTIFFTNKNKEVSLSHILEELNLLGTKSNSKFIPEQYLYSSEKNKMQLLRGLMDTDGTVDKSHIEYYTVSKQLCEDIMNLCRSLGINCNSRIKKTHYKKNGVKIECQDCYRISIFTDKHIFNLKRKQDKIIKGSNRSYSRINKTFIIDIKPVGKRVGKCISVDNYDNTYITRDYIVTHNTFSIIGLCCYLLLMDGTKSISKDWINLDISANIIAGAAGDLPLQEINRRIEVALNCLLTDEDLGVYKAPGIEPIPLIGRHFLGQTNNYLRYRYIVGGRESGGTGSSYRPVSYAANKKGATTSAASTRVALSVVDECGRMPVSIKSIHGSNSALCRRNTKFGVQLMAGTSSSDLDLVQEAKEMFTNPKSFNMHSFRNPYTKEAVSETGLYLPAILVQRAFKDENGNTLVRDVLKYFANRRAKCETPDALREEQLNYPILVEEMWYSRKGSIFNKEQAKKRYQQLLLLKNQGKEETFRRFANLLWNNGKVEVQFINPKEAIKMDNFHESQGSNAAKNKKGDTDTDIIIYEEPEYGKDDMYWFSCDTYVAEEKTEGESLGSIFVFKNPKYIIEGKTGNIVVAEYTGKPDNRDRFYEKLELLMAYYGNPKRSLMFEANRGYDKLVEFFTKKKKEWLLAFAPTNYDGKAKVTFSLKYGYIIGQNKPELLTQFSEWLQELTTLHLDGEKLNVERINSLGLLSEIIHYDFEDDKSKKSNYDRIMSMLGCMIAKRNVYNQYEEKILKEDDNIYSAFKNRKMKTRYKTKSKTWITS